MDLGFVRIESFLNEPSLSELERILKKFHESWLVKNENFWMHSNSAYIANGEFISSSERLELLKFAGSNSVVAEARKHLGQDVRFLNTQLFFNPLDEAQKNYWHRDIQYTGQSTEQFPSIYSIVSLCPKLLSSRVKILFQRRMNCLVWIIPKCLRRRYKKICSLRLVGR